MGLILIINSAFDGHKTATIREISHARSSIYVRRILEKRSHFQLLSRIVEQWLENDIALTCIATSL